MKKFISMLFAVSAIAMMSLSFWVSAASPEEDFEFLPGMGYIDKYIGDDENVVIPETIGGVKVTSIDSQAFFGSKIVSVEIPGCVSSVQSKAFGNCDSLETVIFSSGTTQIASDAFFSCDKLKEVVLPDTLTTLDTGVFKNCISLESIVLPKYITSVPGQTFYGCTSLKNVEYLGVVTSIGDQAFGGCTAFESFEVPENVKRIGSYAFDGCTSLENIVLPNALESLGFRAFAECVKLSRIVIPDGVTEIGGYAFTNCTALKDIELPYNLKSIGNGVFENCVEIEEIEIPESVETIGQDVFKGCTKVVIYGVKGSVAQEYANGSLVPFCALDGGAAAVLKSGVVTNSYVWMLYENGTLEIFGGAGNVPDMEDASAVPWYEYRELITNVVIGDKITYVGKNAFGKGIAAGNTGVYPRLKKIHIKKDAKEIHGLAFGLVGTLETITVDADNPYFVMQDCALYSKDKKMLVKMLAPAGDIVLPSGLEKICDAALAYGYDVTSVTIPDSVKYIGSYAFRFNRKLKSIVLPSRLEAVADCLFEYCSSLETVEIPDGAVSIGNSAFFFCDALKVLVIPESVVSIDLYAISDEVVIYGYSGSAAEDYADEFNVGFIALDKCLTFDTESGIQRLFVGAYPAAMGIPEGYTVSQIKAAAKKPGSLYTVKVYDHDGKAVTSGILKTGYSIGLVKSGKQTDLAVIYVAGDIDGDGNVTMGDINILSMCIRLPSIAYDVYYHAADIDGDRKITYNDFVMMLGLAAK